MEPLQPGTKMAELKEKYPESYDYIQHLIQKTIRIYPEIVKTLAGMGIAGESLHEAMEGLLERGFLRYRYEETESEDEYRIYLQVYDIYRLAYRDVGVNAER